MADSGNMMQVLKKFPEMINEATELVDDTTINKEFIENIIITGMGGSGYTGDLLKVYLQDLPIQLHVVKDYVLPPYATRKSLVFVISYSGNTEETISAYRTAVRRGCKVVSVSSGGKLFDLAKLNKNYHIEVPKNIQPRLSTPYLFISILKVLQQAGIVDEQDRIIKDCVNYLETNQNTIEQKSKELAKKLKGYVPIIYSSQKMFCIAEKWKTDINENAKVHAFYNTFSEFNHNEICAYEHSQALFHVIIISDIQDHERIKKRIQVFKKVVKKYKVDVTEIALGQDSMLTRLFSAILMGLYLGYFLALEYKIDPTPVEIIENLKKELGK
ncbi:MAG: bifunctional phosphoglucose/phosphomannose isomerase [archaeon]